ncbi:sortase [Nocardioides sp. GY 10127]|uniref:sortase domain-containing protein n=1 Tax=Nocardioides sp. GY 10127 TaxID=2569762 RepID=UPI0010A940E7|nr:sortase [Nocardioides sp. GY 10127]TIC79475.1 class E sortase [Nocardioides sp. GY 10127]
MTRRAVVVTGTALVAAGLSTLGWFGWELYGTTWVSQRHQAAAVTQVEQAWASGTTLEKTSQDDVLAIVRIPALGASYAVPARAGEGDDVLAEGFGVPDDSADPGAVGNLVLLGHRITHGEPLRDMPDLVAGDRVIVETADRVFTYRLDTDGDALTVDLHNTWVTDPDPQDTSSDTGTDNAWNDGQPASRLTGSRRLLTLVTCSELFHTDDRLVAFAHLVSSRAR